MENTPQPDSTPTQNQHTNDEIVAALSQVVTRPEAAGKTITELIAMVRAQLDEQQKVQPE